MSNAATFQLPLGRTINVKIAFYVMLVLALSLFALYVYFVNTAVMNVVARQDTENEISSLSSSLGELEFKYITMKNGVTLELAHAKGFEDATPASFIARNKSSLSYNSAR